MRKKRRRFLSKKVISSSNTFRPCLFEEGGRGIEIGITFFTDAGCATGQQRAAANPLGAMAGGALRETCHCAKRSISRNPRQPAEKAVQTPTYLPRRTPRA